MALFPNAELYRLAPAFGHPLLLNERAFVASYGAAIEYFIVVMAVVSGTCVMPCVNELDV